MDTAGFFVPGDAPRRGLHAAGYWMTVLAALGIADEVGSIETGRQADLAIWNVPTHRQIPYWPAADLIRSVVKRGRVVLERPGLTG